MKQYHFLSILLITVFLISQAGYAGAAEHSRKEVQGIIVKVQKKLDEMKSSKYAEMIQDIIIKIEDHIRSSRDLLKSNHVDQAYYEISIGAIYFSMADASISKQSAKRKFQKQKEMLIDKDNLNE